MQSPLNSTPDPAKRCTGTALPSGSQTCLPTVPEPASTHLLLSGPACCNVPPLWLRWLLSQTSMGDRPGLGRPAGTASSPSSRPVPQTP